MSSDARLELQLPPELRAKLDAAAREFGCTITAEIVNRLWFTFDPEVPAAMITSEPLRLPEMPTLRDQFAMAVAGDVFDSAASHNREQIASPSAWPLTLQDVADKAYALADAMLAARATEPANG